MSEIICTRCDKPIVDGEMKAHGPSGTMHYRCFKVGKMHGQEVRRCMNCGALLSADARCHQCGLDEPRVGATMTRLVILAALIALPAFAADGPTPEEIKVLMQVQMEEYRAQVAAANERAAGLRVELTLALMRCNKPADAPKAEPEKK